MGIVDRTGSLNKAQSEPNADGTWTYVLSNADPGVHNWVDPCGLTEGILTLRMAEFPDQRPTEGLSASGQVVKLADLESVLPAGTRRGHRRRAGRPARRSSRGLRPTPARGRCREPLAHHRVLDRDRAGHRRRRPRRRALGGGHRPPARDGAGPGRRPSRHAPSPSRSTSPTAPRSTTRWPRPTPRSAGVDVLVNNAGYGYLSAVEEGDDAEVRALFDTNFFGAVDMIKAVLPGMRAQGDGHIVNVSSMTGIVTNPPNTYYSCTKHALEALTEGLAKEVGPLGIKVCAIEPGAFQTDYITRSMHQADEHRRLRPRRRAQGAHQGVRRAPPGRPGQARRRGAAARRAWTTRRSGSCWARTCSHAFREKTAAWTATVDEWEPVTTAVNFD